MSRETLESVTIKEENRQKLLENAKNLVTLIENNATVDEISVQMMHLTRASINFYGTDFMFANVASIVSNYTQNNK